VCESVSKHPFEWFEIWKQTIYNHKHISRVTLSESSGASLWIIKSLQKDFLEFNPDIYYKDSVFHLKKFELDKTLSHTLQEDMK